VHVDLGAKSFWVEHWQKNTNTWVTEGVVNTWRRPSISPSPARDGAAAEHAARNRTGAAVPGQRRRRHCKHRLRCLQFPRCPRGPRRTFRSRVVPTTCRQLNGLRITVTTGGMVQLWRANVSGGNCRSTSHDLENLEGEHGRGSRASGASGGARAQRSEPGGVQGPRRSRNDAGSTLVEVIVAILIMARSRQLFCRWRRSRSRSPRTRTSGRSNR
jgi:hypothetical protein